jgi:hypothetical protein
MNKIDKIINELSTGKPISEALKAVCEQRHIVLFIKEEHMNVDIAKVVNDTRTSNALKRSGLFTLQNVLEYVENGNKISELPYVGERAIRYLLERILDYNWDCMDNNERAEFLLKVVGTE